MSCSLTALWTQPAVVNRSSISLWTCPVYTVPDLRGFRKFSSLVILDLTCSRLKGSIELKTVPTIMAPIMQQQQGLVNTLQQDVSCCRLPLKKVRKAEKWPVVPLQVKLTLL